jgi:glycosyltransferase involved in cell wall biosynthesis
MKILQLCTSDRGGGAEKVAYDLFQAYRGRGHDSHLVVGYKKTEEEGVFEIPNNFYRHPWTQVWRNCQKSFSRNNQGNAARVSRWLANLGEIRRNYERWRGIEDFNFPGSTHLLEITPCHPDIIHAHNLHGDYFDLRALPYLNKIAPVILTLHDEWTFTGHCAYGLDCSRWELGCGKCPHLETHPSIRRDATAQNLQRKHQIYSRTRLYITAPSRWLLDRASRSVLQPGIIEARLIPYGVDLTTFCPKDRLRARRELGLEKDCSVVLFVGNRARSNQFKAYTVIEDAVRQVAAQSRGRQVIFLCVGEKGTEERFGSAIFRFIEYQTDPGNLAKFYQAADVFLHAAHADNFPNTVLESLACGTPVVATAVGGIPEQVDEGLTGFLVPKGDSDAMALRTMEILSNNHLQERMGRNATEMARRHFDLNKQVESHLSWYHEIMGRSRSE